MLFNLIYNIAVGGVNHSLAGNGGEDCVNFIPHWQRLLETIFFVWLGNYGIRKSASYLYESVEKLTTSSETRNGTTAKKTQQIDNVMFKGIKSWMNSLFLYFNDYKICIASICNTLKKPSTQNVVFKIYFTVFVIELLYKIFTRTAIFLLNPCHMSTILQLILLKIHEKNHLAVPIFRFHLYTMPGALLAVLFPILNTRLMPGEVLIYYIQHLLILIIPIYLMFIKESFYPEAFSKMSWAIFSVSVIVLYHFVFLQFMGLFTSVNLNCILCPAVSDPFSGRMWRIIAVIHQSVAIPIITKLYGFLSLRYILIVKSYLMVEKCE